MLALIAELGPQNKWLWLWVVVPFSLLAVGWYKRNGGYRRDPHDSWILWCGYGSIGTLITIAGLLDA